eukprot:TRINITY_DN2902_c0_g1_i13.p1 TRINITY_DN2902_c0_g1~~TRINITY_DN2902_c0_g1_i13.p1  ORF type:complete len:271 (+),score=77.13 TRINITY_DN2902_c0_g1_i13:227-1039(+)
MQRENIGITKIRNFDYIALRREARNRRQRFQGQTTNYVQLGEEEEMKSYNQIIPRWLDVYEEAADKIDGINKIYEEIKRLTEEKRKKPFESDEKEKKIEKLVDEATEAFHQTEELLERMRNESVLERSAHDSKVKQNSIRTLAISLQQAVNRFRHNQKSLFDFLEKSKLNQIWVDGDDASSKRKDEKNEMKFEVEMAQLEREALERGEQIDTLVGNIHKLNQIFKHLNRMILEQGTILDRIDFNMEQTLKQTVKATTEINKVHPLKSPPP